MKKYFWGFLVGIMALSMTSCEFDDDDAYSLSDVWVSFGIFYEDDDASQGYSILLDNGDVIYPVATNVALDQYDDSSRVLVYYTILDDKESSGENDEYLVKINSMRNILMKGILDITEEIEDSIGSDPIIVKDVWFSGGLLNFELKYWGNYKVHYINLVKQPGELTAADQPFKLEIRHNDNNDSHNISYSAYVSFDLSKLKVASLDSVRFEVTATDYYNDEFKYNGVYKYGDN